VSARLLPQPTGSYCFWPEEEKAMPTSLASTVLLPKSLPFLLAMQTTSLTCVDGLLYASQDSLSLQRLWEPAFATWDTWHSSVLYYGSTAAAADPLNNIHPAAVAYLVFRLVANEFCNGMYSIYLE
jgi:hypothetical protein